MDFKQDSFPTDDYTDGIRSSEKIKILLCYILKTVEQPLTKDFLLTTLYGNSIANYFEISQALYELEKVNAVKMTDECVYVLTEAGKKIADDLQGELSSFIKHKATSASLKAIVCEKRNRENTVNTVKLEDNKYRVDISLFSMADKNKSEDKLLDVSIYVADEMQAEIIKKSFFNNPTMLYENIIKALTENTEFKQ